tara:strand:- start:312 stop:752 length:441 start_codon:yes stop_codon:yes gene_type:complete
MFIQCSDCHYKYLVNSADLKPDGRMVECANCNHQWFQEPVSGEDLLSSSVPKTQSQQKVNSLESSKNQSLKQITNLPSTVVKDKKVSTINSLLVIFFLFFAFYIFWSLKSYGTNIFVLINFYINEFFFNLKLIIEDLAKIIHQVLN